MSFVKFNSLSIKPSCVLLAKTGTYPSFLLVEAVYASGGLPFICGHILETLYFDEHFQAYKVKKTANFSHMNELHICHPYPMHLRKVPKIGYALTAKNYITYIDL